MALEDDVANPPGPWLRAHATEVPFNPNTACITCTPPECDPDVVAFTEHWKVVLHPDQTVAGACLFGSRRHVGKVSALTPVEAADLFALYATVEPVLEQVLGADLVNLSCLRNWAYRDRDPEPPWRDGRPNPHVHWHVAPRYREPVTVAGETFLRCRLRGGTGLEETAARPPRPPRDHRHDPPCAPHRVRTDHVTATHAGRGRRSRSGRGRLGSRPRGPHLAAASGRG